MSPTVADLAEELRRSIPTLRPAYARSLARALLTSTGAVPPEPLAALPWRSISDSAPITDLDYDQAVKRAKGLFPWVDTPPPSV